MGRLSVVSAVAVGLVCLDCLCGLSFFLFGVVVLLCWDVGTFALLVGAVSLSLSLSLALALSLWAGLVTGGIRGDILGTLRWRRGCVVGFRS